MPTDPTLLTAIAPRVDKHLLLPVLKFAAEKTTDAALKTQYTQSIAALSAQTTMPGDHLSQEQQAEVEANFSKALKAAGPLIDLFFNNEEGQGLSLKFVGKEFGEARRAGKFGSAELKEGGVKPRNIRALYDVAFAFVDSGNYAQGAAVLKVHNEITTRDSMDADADTNARVRSALWGQYMCEVLLGERDASKYALDQLHQMLDDRAADEANKARADLLHWGLFHWFKNRETSAFLDLLFTFDKADRSKTYLYANVAQCMAPHLLRYIAIAAVLNKKKRATLTRAARILDGDAYHYTDVFTRFLVELCVRTDFTKATALLAECDKALADDYFAADLRKDFVANARQMLFEDQLRVRKSLSISSAATQLGMTSDEAELWLVDLIREAKLDAAVDSVAGTVRVSGTAMQKTVWQHVLDRLENASGGKAAMM